MYKRQVRNNVGGGSNNITIQAKSGEDSAIFNPDSSVDLFHNDGVRFQTSGIGITVYGVAVAGQFTGAVNAGVATVTSTLDLGGVSKLGVQTSTPQSQFHVFNVGVSSIQVESGSAESILSLGTNVNTRQTSAEIVYGKDGLTYGLSLIHI